MATRIETTVTINHAPEKVFAALTNADYWAYNVANLSTEPGEVHSFTATGTGAEAVLYEIMPMDLLPEAVRAMISQSLKIKRVFTVASESAASYTADVKGAPVDFKGDIAIAGEGDTTTLTYANEVSVTIPFMGPAIEPKVAEALGELLANEAALTEKWISENL
ncbi:DUF2505 domain-containing protein [Corynebacterium canis]|uniref:DUF2505 domain-containing protein n=1 Tax=Corynebacterium canis TaxID=679663 RepID=A0A5C5UIV8_9CORY|nr:DUF2505 domain-containing protein [Corynebacterium canis]TWT25552.1 DUF2505 domain-containing protein [Corynebacterium canis]WJY74084.1 hypothetical protein CCANI_01110 [Corynebacterium canis]